MQAALKEFLILPPTPENKALFLSQWPLASLFGAITETGDKLNDLIVSSLNRVFEGVEGIDILQRPDLVSVLPVAVAHPHANVRALACRHVCRFFADDEGIAFLRQRDLIVDLLQRIEDDDMGVMNIVAQGFVACCKRQSGCVSFFENTKIIKKLELLLLSRNSIIRLRTLSLLAQLREASTDANKNVAKTLYQKVLRQDLLSDDVLGRMATFELFKTMGPDYIDLSLFNAAFDKMMADPITSLQCMEVSGSLLATIGAAPGTPSAELGQRWLGHVDMMLDAPLEGGEDPCVSCIMEILRSERGLEVLKPSWPKVIVGLGTRIASTNDVARAGAINALTQWIRIGATSSREQDLLIPVLDQQLSRLIDCAMKPLVGQRLIIYNLFVLLASRDFGIRVLQRCADFSTWLLARADEFTLEALQGRHEIAVAVTGNRDAPVLLGPKVYGQIRSYARDGPYSGSAKIVSAGVAMPGTATRGA